MFFDHSRAVEPELPHENSDAIKHARTVIFAAAVLGLLSDFLFHETLFKSVPWGLNLFVWLLSVSVASLILTCRTKPTSQWKSLWFLVPPLFLAAGCAWRDSPVLRWLDIGLLFFFLWTTSMSMTGGRMMFAGIWKYVCSIFVAVESFLDKPYQLLFKDARWHDMMTDGSREKVSAVLRGTMIALPLLTIFGALFVAADAAFETLVKESFQLDVGQGMQHLLLGLGSFWCLGGYLHGMLAERTKTENADLAPATLFEPSLSETPGAERSQPQPVAPEVPKLGLVECGVVLASIDLLFLAFVVVQAKYFFGGAGLVEVTHGLTYAEYARRGFFELVTVASLVIPMLLVIDWLVDKTSKVGTILIRALTGVQIGLLFVIMISAVTRMRLYQSEYGMTELRLYTTAFMAWLAVVCVMFIATVLRGRRNAFAFCSLMSGLLVVGGLHVINPDEMIMKTNIARAKEGKTFDVVYALQLSDDAVPALIEGLPHLAAIDQKRVYDQLKPSLGNAWKSDWRSWNWSASAACQAAGNYLSQAEHGTKKL